MEASDAKAQLKHMVCRLRERRKTMGNWGQSLLAQFILENAQERADHVAQVLESTNETRNQVDLPDDLLIKIFISLPAESLFRVQFVCKRWFNLISSPTFVRLHAKQSETFLICRRLNFSPNHVDETTNSYFHFMDLDKNHLRHIFVNSSIIGMINVLSSYDGLVLVQRENSTSLILTNPVTRKCTELPPSKVTTSNESYGLAFCNKENTYKVVHLFSAKPSYIGCRVLSISTRKWITIEGFSHEQLPYGRQNMVYANGKVYWTPRYNHVHFHKFVTLNLQNEQCITRNLPVRRTMRDQLLEVGGVLGFLTYETNDLLQVWILKETDEECYANWIKRCSIDLCCIRHYGAVPVCSPRNGIDMVFYSPPRRITYVYDFEKGDKKLTCTRDDIESWSEPVEKLYIPHRHTLASWET